jgi:hypothetical protein
MKILGKNCVAIFLAAALVTGIFSVISPSFDDAEASGDRNNDKRHGDKSKSVIVKKFICNQNNIDVGGVGIDVRPNDIASTLAGAQEQEESNQELSANSMGNNERPNGERNGGNKQHDDKKIVFICINNGNVPPPVDVIFCEDCFITTRDGGFVPVGQLRNIVEFLDENFNADLEDLCRAIESGRITEGQLEALLNAALPGSQQRLVGLLLDCLSEFFPDENGTDLTENIPLNQTP